MKSFYQFVLTYRGANDAFGQFAEAVFDDHSFPKRADTFEELSAYVEMQADAWMTTSVFDTLWDVYQTKYVL